jgi:UDP-glucose 4-epimerase
VSTIYGDGKQTRDYVYVEDVTDACWRAALQGGGRYLNIGTGVETTVVDLYAKMAAIVGSDAEPMHAAPRPGEQQRSCLDPSEAARDLGWEAWTTLDDGLVRAIDWTRENL